MADHRHQVAALKRERMSYRLLESALKLVASEGLSELSIDRIIETAGVSRGTFYKYFTSPSDLVRAVAQEVVGELLRAIDHEAVMHHDAAERIAVACRLILSVARHHPIIGGFFVRLGWPSGLIGGDAGSTFFKVVPRDIESGMERGEFIRAPLTIPLNLIAGTIVGGIHTLLTETPADDYEGYLVAAILRGLGVEKKRALKLAFIDIEDIAVEPNCFLGRILLASSPSAPVNGEASN